MIVKERVHFIYLLPQNRFCAKLRTMAETRKNHLAIDGAQVKDVEHIASYKPIPEADSGNFYFVMFLQNCSINKK